MSTANNVMRLPYQLKDGSQVLSERAIRQLDSVGGL